MNLNVPKVNPSLALKDRECYACGSNETYVKPNAVKVGIVMAVG